MSRHPSSFQTVTALGATWLIMTGAGADEVIDLGRGPVVVQVPPSYDPDVAAPLVMLLHGYTSSGQDVEDWVQLAPLADAYGFVYLFPDGSTDCLGSRFWNATDACCNLCGSDIDDSGYLLALIDEVKTLLNVDPRRIYIAGHSNGGFMAHRMACDHSETIAAIASFAGATFLDTADCAPAGPVHALQIHGTADLVIRYDGGCIFGNCYPGAVETTEQWATHNACSLVADESQPPLDLAANAAGSETTVTRYADSCEPGGSAELWSIVGAGHSPALSSDFALLLVELLLSHPKPACGVNAHSDLVDFNIHLQCFTGPGAPMPPHCACADADNDGDVDFADFQLLQLGFTTSP